MIRPAFHTGAGDVPNAAIVRAITTDGIRRSAIRSLAWDRMAFLLRDVPKNRTPALYGITRAGSFAVFSAGICQVSQSGSR